MRYWKRNGRVRDGSKRKECGGGGRRGENSKVGSSVVLVNYNFN